MMTLARVRAIVRRLELIKTDSHLLSGQSWGVSVWIRRIISKASVDGRFDLDLRILVLSALMLGALP
jgi:hypothetical protein